MQDWLTREELLEIGRKDLNELVDFAFRTQQNLRTSSQKLQKQIDAVAAELDKLLADRQ